MRKGLIATLLISLMIVLAACGGGDNNNNTNANGNKDASNDQAISNDLNITATDFEFDQEEYTVKAGEEVTINFENEQGLHGFAIDEFDVDIQGDGEATFTPEEPGEYEIHCSIVCGVGHDTMKSTLIVVE